jgi:hypothetical protein
LTEAKNDYVVQTNTNISPERIAYVICAGVEGGISYWATDFLLKQDAAVTLADGKTRGMRPTKPGEHWYVDPALYAGDGFVIEVIQIEEHATGAGKSVLIDKAAIQEALQIMADKYPWHWENIVKENEDSETGDVLIQLAAFKEIVYG